MLAVVLSEVLQFLSRRSLDELHLVSRLLNATIDVYCVKFPHRQLEWLTVGWRGMDATEQFQVSSAFDSRFLPYRGITDAMRYAKSILSRSLVERVTFYSSLSDNELKFSAADWALVQDVLRSGVLHRVEFLDVDLSALTGQAFFDLAAASGMRE